jgi:putative flippase GtrA
LIPAKSRGAADKNGFWLIPRAVGFGTAKSWTFGSMNFLFRQFSSFVVVGFIATGVHYALLIGLVEIAGISAVAAALVGYGAGGTVSYGLNRRLTFRTKLPHEAAVSRFTVVAAVGFGLTYIFMSLFVHAAGIPYLPAQVATTGIVLLWNFAAHRMWTFPADRDAKGLAAAAERHSRPPREGR